MQNLIELESLKNNISIIWFKNEPVNAISLEFLVQFKSILDKIKKNHTIRCLIIGSKIKHFCAGADLKERKLFSQNKTINFLQSINQTFTTLESLPIPTISMLKGATLGGGAELSLCTDFRIADSTLKIGFPETSLGIIPGAGGTYRLPKIIGIQNSKYLIYTAKKISSKTAKDLGLVDVISENLFEESEKLAISLIKNSPIGLSSAKSAINNSFNMDYKSGLDIERNAYLKTIGTNDRNEALKAFKEKRKPVWHNN